MPIQLETSGFYEWHDGNGCVPMLGVDTSRLDACLDHFHAGGFRGLFGHPSFGFTGQDLDFLARTPNATHLWMWDIALKNIDGLDHLRGLEHLGINPKRPGIDFARFPSLTTVVNHWIPADHGLAESAIREYHFWHFKPRTKTYHGLELPAGVRRLEIHWANPSSLDGLPTLPELESLGLHCCRSLADVSALPRIAPNLRRFYASSCKRIEVCPGIREHPTLTRAAIDAKVVLLQD